MSVQFSVHPPDTKISDEEHRAIFVSCTHKDSKPRWRNAKQQAVWLQCLICGTAVGKAIKLSTFAPSELCSLGMWDATLAQQRSAQERQAYESKKQEKDAGWWDWYNEYLNSPAWKAKSEAVLIRDGRWCQGCREKPATQAHHLSYEHVGKEFLFELIAVCRECHARAHPHMDEQNGY